jgi:fatty acid desaturase
VGCLGWLEFEGGDDIMLWTIFIILLVLWLLGLISGYTMGGFIHILLVIAVVVLIIRLIQGRPIA